MIVLAQVNLWFSGPRPGRARGVSPWQNYGYKGKRCAVKPRHGYISSDEWDTQRESLGELVDAAGGKDNFIALIQHSGEDTLIDRRLPYWIDKVARPLGIRFAIFYDPVISLRSKFGPALQRFNVAESVTADVIETDVDYLRRAYSNKVNYWRHEGRPVLYIWALHSGVRNGADCWRRLHQRGWHVLGDVQGAAGDAAADGLDGVTGFTSAFPGTGQQHRWIDQLTHTLEAEWDRWADFPGLSIPATSFQYDDVRLQLAHGGSRLPTTHLARDRNELHRLVQALRRPARKAGYVLLGTADNWPEGTTLLPTATGMGMWRKWARKKSGVWRMGHYGYEHLKGVEALVR